jgi:O-acetylserine/cysteine efflux transporter
VVLIFGANFIAMKYALMELPPILLVSLRFMLVLLPAVFFIPRPRTSWAAVAAVGFFIGTVQVGLLLWALQLHVITAGLAALMLQLQVPVTIALSVLIFRESIRGLQLFGILLAAGGFLLFLYQEEGSVTPLGATLVGLAAVSWACGNLFIKTLKETAALSLAVWSSFVPALFMLGLSLRGWLSLFFLAYAATLLGYSLWNFLVERYQAATVMPFALLIPPIGMVLGAFAFQETLTLLEGCGTLVVMLGLVFCLVRFRKKSP